MINILIKVDRCHTIAILDDNSIHLYNESVEDFMDKYLLNILRTYETSIIRGKFISGISKYKAPLAYHSINGLNILVPINSTRKENCIWISLNYFLKYSRDEFEQLTGHRISFYQWGRLFQICLDCQKRFNFKLTVPNNFTSISKKELKELLNNF
ncbi:MAG: hypothetical protein ACLSXC_00015 [Beduini sp.]